MSPERYARLAKERQIGKFGLYQLTASAATEGGGQKQGKVSAMARGLCMHGRQRNL